MTQALPLYTVQRFCSTINGASFWILMGPFFASAEVHKAIEGPMVDSPYHTWFVAMTQDVPSRVLGFVALDISKMKRTGAAECAYAYIEPASRDQGIYEALHQDRIAFARQLGIDRLTVKANAMSSPFLLSQGFSIVRTRGKHGQYCDMECRV